MASRFSAFWNNLGKAKHNSGALDNHLVLQLASPPRQFRSNMRRRSQAQLTHQKDWSMPMDSKNAHVSALCPRAR
jgi:hypothetical protein